MLCLPAEVDGRLVAWFDRRVASNAGRYASGWGARPALRIALRASARGKSADGGQGSAPGYAAAFHAAFPVLPGAIGLPQVSQALASFERTLVAGTSPFDRYAYAGVRSALSAAAVRGLALFNGDARCATCHVIAARSAIFSDDRFHSVSGGLRPLGPRLSSLTRRVMQDRERGAKLDQSVLSDAELAQLGRFLVTLDPRDIGKFRTPGLRNVARTAPYMHDGSVATLAEAVELELYYRSVDTGRPMILTPGEKDDLVEFLKALNSEESVALPTNGGMR